MYNQTRFSKEIYNETRGGALSDYTMFLGNVKQSGFRFMGIMATTAKSYQDMTGIGTCFSDMKDKTERL